MRLNIRRSTRRYGKQASTSVHGHPKLPRVSCHEAQRCVVHCRSRSEEDTTPHQGRRSRRKARPRPAVTLQLPLSFLLVTKQEKMSKKFKHHAAGSQGNRQELLTEKRRQSRSCLEKTRHPRDSTGYVPLRHNLIHDSNHPPAYLPACTSRVLCVSFSSHRSGFTQRDW